MRGKNILWLSFIAMFLSVMVMVNVDATEPTVPTLYIDPKEIPGGKHNFGHPGDQYTMSIMIEDVEDLWTIGFEIHFRPFASVLLASELTEGPFLKDGWDWPGSTSFAKSIDTLYGIIYVSLTRMPEPFTGNMEGASGSGTLMTFKLTVIEAGDSPIDLENSVLIKPNGVEMLHKTKNSMYRGVRAQLEWGGTRIPRRVTVGEVFTLPSEVKNMGDEPLTVRVRFDIDRAEDARRITIRSGQTYGGGGVGEPLPFEYLYLDEFNEWFYEWKNPATNALGTPDGLYIEGDANGQWASLYSFEDISLAGREINDIFIEGYSQYPNGANEGADIDLYGFSTVQGFAWLGSNYGTASWGWRGTRWTADSVLTIMPELADEAELNGMELLIYNYYGDAPDVLRVDSVRLKVEFASITPVTPPEFVVQPGERLNLEAVIWPSTEDHIGNYVVTATVEYQSEGIHWNSWGKKTQRIQKLEIRP